MGPPSHTALYYLSFSNLLRMRTLVHLTRSNQAGRRNGFAARITTPSLWPKPVRPAARPWKPTRLGIILLQFLWIAAAALAQENLPASLETKIAAGVQALKSGDLESAEQAFSDALRQGIKHPLIYHNLGVIAQLRGNHAQAVTRFRQALALQPDYGPSRLLLGASLLALRKNAEALRELKRAVALMPEQPQSHLQLAKAYEATDNWIAAVQQFQKLVELDPQEPDYSYQLGTAWAKLSGWSYGQITRINPHSARLQQALGQEYVLQEKYDLALAAYQQAARSDPEMAELHLAMALILLELKKFDQALAEIELELKLVPESKAAVDAKAKIQAAIAASTP
jgi:tetratricopeptide (TPR) repeat protein